MNWSSLAFAMLHLNGCSIGPIFQFVLQFCYVLNNKEKTGEWIIVSIDLHQIRSYKRRWRRLLIKWIFKIEFVSGCGIKQKRAKEINLWTENFRMCFVHLICFCICFGSGAPSSLSDTKINLGRSSKESLERNWNICCGLIFLHT
jgi:hypothetical protein